ncbi:MAG: tripartite tricarboxylate transporter substrate binding protein [Gammaproteobacteria bacterium]|nr:tripartite tricarboxylate transporter substrate binding protein [Gammaproteobacteria bacterium]
MLKSLSCFMLWAAAAWPIAPAHAQSPAPAKAPVRFIIPLPPGSAQDAIARRLAERMSTVWSQPAFVDNKPGASGILATDAVVKSPGDGSVLSFTMASTITIAPHTFRKLPYDPLRDLKPVIQVGTTPLVLVVNASNPARTLKEFLDNARKQPGKVSFGSFGNGTSAHLLGEELNLKANTKLLHVPYKTVATTDLLGGTLDSIISDFGSIRDFLRPPAKLRALALTGDHRSPDYPDVPTFGEQGYPSFDPMVGWVGVFAPATLPDAQVERLAKEFSPVVQGAEVQEQLRSFGYESSGLTGNALRQYVKDDYARWGAIAKAIGLELN